MLSGPISSGSPLGEGLFFSLFTIGWNLGAAASLARLFGEKAGYDKSSLQCYRHKHCVCCDDLLRSLGLAPSEVPLINVIAISGLANVFYCCWYLGAFSVTVQGYSSRIALIGLSLIIGGFGRIQKCPGSGESAASRATREGFVQCATELDGRAYRCHQDERRCARKATD